MLTLESNVKIADDVIFQEVDGEAVLLNMRTEIYFGLDSLGARIWGLVQSHGRIGTVVRMLTEEYDIGEDRLGEEICEFIEKLRSKGLVEVQ